MATQNPTPYTLDQGISRAVAHRISAQPRECFRNALMALLTDTTLQGDCAYVEGAYVPSTGIPAEHAWIEMPGGGVVDPTIVTIGTDMPVYFPGNRYRFHEAASFIGKTLPHYGHLGAPLARRVRRAYGRALLYAMGMDRAAGVDPASEARIRTLYGLLSAGLDDPTEPDPDQA